MPLAGSLKSLDLMETCSVAGTGLGALTGLTALHLLHYPGYWELDTAAVCVALPAALVELTLQ